MTTIYFVTDSPSHPPVPSFVNDFLKEHIGEFTLVPAKEKDCLRLSIRVMHKGVGVWHEKGSWKFYHPDGPYRHWNGDGRLWMEGQHEEGERHGWWITHMTTGPEKMRYVWGDIAGGDSGSESYGSD